MLRIPHCLDLGSPNFFSLRASLTPPLSPKGQDLASSSYQHTVVLNYAEIFVLGLAGEWDIYGDIFKEKYLKSSLLEFYKSLPVRQFDQLHKFARGFFPAFGTTYLCEKTFSKMKYTKNIYRSKLTDEHLKSLLIISTSKLDPQLQTIVSGKLQLHKSR
jgi:hypothetical protein